MAIGALAIAGAMAIPPVVAAAESASGAGLDPWTLIGSVITPVIVVVLLIIGKLHTDVDYQRVVKYGADEHDERIRLQTVITDNVLPNQHRATLIMESLLPVVESEVRLRQARDQQAGGA